MAIAPVLAWLFFVLREDLHPEPKRLLVYAFFMGMIVTVPTLLMQTIVREIFQFGDVPGILPLVCLAMAEEFFKFIAAYWTVKGEKAFDEPVDAMIYMITAALGFTVVENIFIAMGALASPEASLGTIFDTMILRFIGATFLHVLASGIVGYYWARGKMMLSARTAIIFGLILGTSIHTLFNFLVVIFQDVSLLYPSLLLIFGAFFLFYDFEKLRYKKPFSQI
jgi:RsiW-degrading membrane proteinase PrsW (M82 family)